MFAIGSHRIIRNKVGVERDRNKIPFYVILVCEPYELLLKINWEAGGSGFIHYPKGWKRMLNVHSVISSIWPWQGVVYFDDDLKCCKNCPEFMKQW